MSFCQIEKLCGMRRSALFFIASKMFLRTISLLRYITISIGLISMSNPAKCQMPLLACKTWKFHTPMEHREWISHVHLKTIKKIPCPFIWKGPLSSLFISMHLSKTDWILCAFERYYFAGSICYIPVFFWEARGNFSFCRDVIRPILTLWELNQ